MAIDRAFNPKRKRTVKSFLAALRHDSFYLFLHRCTTGLVDLGDPANGCNWTVRTSQLGPDSIVYSAGIGRDITFEHALADKFGFKIVLMDPSPTGAETMKLPENQRPEFIYLEVALAGHNGKLVLSSPLVHRP